MDDAGDVFSVEDQLRFNVLGVSRQTTYETCKPNFAIGFEVVATFPIYLLGPPF